jgi:ABC-type multidrug transport system ATPase subunit
MVALYQAGETLTREFDKVTILYLGHQVFFGTVADAKTYFEDLGFLCRPRQTTADFLTAITDPYARRVKEGWATRVPRTPGEFVQVWKKSPHYAQLRSEMQQYDEDFAQPQIQLEKYGRYQAA